MGDRIGVRDFSRLDHAVSAAHRFFFVKLRIPTVIAAAAAYAALVLCLGRALAVSANYFVIIPVIVSAVAFGFWGGLAAGVLGLPANLLLFHLLGHPEFSPASKPIAEFSGVVLGAALGYLSDLYGKLQAEIERRMRTEETLVLALEDKDVLLQEVNHRVRNNLNVIKSLIGLQAARNKDPAFQAAARQLQQRVFAIALVQEQLYGKTGISRLRPSEYVPQLVANLLKAFGAKATVAMSVDDGDESLSMDQATPLGLIISEVITNSMKHAAREGGESLIRVEFAREDGQWILRLADDGPGFDPAACGRAGLGLKLVETLCRQLGGSYSLNAEAGTAFAFAFPALHAAGAAPSAEGDRPRRPFLGKAVPGV